MVRAYAVHLFGIALEPGASTGLRVADRDAELRRREGPGKSGVRVAVEQYCIGRLLDHRVFEGDQHPCRHLRMGSSRYAEIDLRFGNPELLEK